MSLLDYGAGNVRSVRNAIAALGYRVIDVKSPKDIVAAKRLVRALGSIWGKAPTCRLCPAAYHNGFCSVSSTRPRGSTSAGR